MSNVLNVTDPNPLIKPKVPVDDAGGGDEPELVVIDELEQQQARKKLQGRDDDERRGRRTRDDDDDDEPRRTQDRDSDERLGRGREDLDDDERERRRLRNRQSKQEGKRRREEAIRRNNTELTYLRQRNDELERLVLTTNHRVSRVEAQSVDGQIQGLQTRLEQADQVLAAAVDASNGEDVVKVTRIRDQIISELGRLNAVKQHVASQQRTTQSRIQQGGRPAQSADQGPDPGVIREASVFQRRNSWFNPKGTDEDSAIVFALDNALSRDPEWDPTTPEYWDELERRAAKMLPHRFDGEPRRESNNRQREDDDFDDEDDEDEPERRPVARKNGGGGPRMPSRGEGSGRKVTFHLSAARRQALEENGLWEDPVLRKRYIKKMQEWDAAHARDRR